MTIDERISKLREVRTKIKYIMSDLIPVPTFPTDTNREYYFFTEIDTLMVIPNMIEQKQYKESFILIRTIFEKFLFFWLMFEGKKYRHPMTYNIIRETSKTIEEARNSTFAKWQKLWKEGDEKFREVISMQRGKNENIIRVVYEFEGYQLLRDGIPTGEIIPVYNAILEQYRPDVAHLGNLNFLAGKSAPTKNSEVIDLQKTLYHNFFYVESIFRNLGINNLVHETQLSRIRVHYNFLSKYVHVSMDNLKIWKDFEHLTNQKSYEEEVYQNLILLYVTKLFHLFLKVYVLGYKENSNDNFMKYNQLVEKLESLSKDLWFFDNEPTEYDVKSSEYLKEIRRRMGKTNSDDMVYYDDPLERVKMLMDYNQSK